MNPSTSGDKKILYTVIAVVIILAIVIIWQLVSVMGGGGTGYSSSTASGAQNSQVSSSNSGTNLGASTGSGSMTQLDAFVANAANLQQLINSAKVRIPNTAIDTTLVNGTRNYVESAVNGNFTVNKILGQVKVQSSTASNATSSYDVFADITMTSSSTQPVERIGLFNVTLNGATLASSVVVGQRVIVTGLLVGDTAASDVQYSYSNTGKRYATVAYSVGVHYLDRKNGEPITAIPTVPKDVQFNVKGHNISQ